MYKKVIGLFLLVLVYFSVINAQTPLAIPDSLALPVIDSAFAKPVDSLTPQILKLRDSATNVLWLDSLSRGYGFEVFSLNNHLKRLNYTPEIVNYQAGDLLPKGDLWVLAIIGFLLVLFAVLKNTFAKQLSAVVQSFYSNRALSNLNREDNLVTSWSFLLLFIQFGFTIGMFLYLAIQTQYIKFSHSGFELFIYISVGVIVLYLFKIIFLRFIGFVFGVQKPLKQYISILYLSYFNTSLLFVPIIIAFALSPAKYGSSYVLVGFSVLALIFVSQFVRAAVNILSQHRFPKLYLILYFCTLEICPILILIKAIGL